MAVDLSVLSEMVRRNVRLILPEVGAFFVRELESGFRVENVTFSTFLRYDDGKLTELLAQAKGLTPAEAAQQSAAMCEYVLGQLSSQGLCALPGLGVLKRYQDGQVEFVAGDMGASQAPSEEEKPVAAGPIAAVPPAAQPGVGANASPQREGAQGAKPQSKETVQSRAQRRQQGTPARSMTRTVANRSNPSKKAVSSSKPSGESRGGGFVKFVLVLLCLVVVAGAADFLWFGWVSASLFPGKAPYLKVRTERELKAASQSVRVAEEHTEEGTGVSTEDGGGVGEEEESADEQSPLAQEFKERTSDENAAASQAARRASVAALPQQQPHSEVPSAPVRRAVASSSQAATSVERGYSLPSGENSYHVVVGSFTERDNADRFCRQLQSRGYASGIIERDNGRNAVTVGSFETLRAASVACDGMKNRFPDAWVLQY